MIAKSHFEMELERLCNQFPRCYCPPLHEAHHVIANSPAWLRRYFSELGKEEERARAKVNRAWHELSKEEQNAAVRDALGVKKREK